MKFKIVQILVMAVFFSQNLAAQNNMEEVKAAIQKAADSFSSSYMKGAYEAMANAYTKDAVLMSPGQEMIYGREDIYKFWSKDTLYRQVYHRSESDRLEIFGDFAFDNGYWYSKANYDGKARPMFSGKYLIIWKREGNGEWKMHHDIWNNRQKGWEEKEEN